MSIFIVIEGADAVGKHTQTERLVNNLRRHDIAVSPYSFPRYAGEVGPAILRHLKKETQLVSLNESPPTRHMDDALLFQSLMLVDKSIAAVDIRSDLAKGRVVVADRWWQSAYVYAGAEGVSDDLLMKMHALLPKATLNILLDLDPKVALERRPKVRDRYEADRVLMERVKSRYLDLWARKPEAGERYVVLDAAQDPDLIESQILDLVFRADDTSDCLEVLAKLLTDELPESA